MNVETGGFELGDTVRDSVTGLEGVISGVHAYQTGCARISIQPKVGADNKVPDSYSVDYPQLELVTPGPRHVVAASTSSRAGGPHDEPARSFPGERP